MEKVCFMFGHTDTSQSVFSNVYNAVAKVYENGTRNFLIGYYGNFDQLSISALKWIKHQHNDVRLMLLTPWHPAERTIELPAGFDEILYPPLENVPKRFCIVRANEDTVHICDSVICYVSHRGNA